jgi:hypothetical protein
MDDHQQKVRHWRIKAAEIRTTIEGMKRGDHRDSMLGVAASFDRLANEEAAYAGYAKRIPRKGVS